MNDLWKTLAWPRKSSMCGSGLVGFLKSTSVHLGHILFKLNYSGFFGHLNRICRIAICEVFFFSAQSFILQPWIEQKMSPTDAKKCLLLLLRFLQMEGNKKNFFKSLHATTAPQITSHFLFNLTKKIPLDWMQDFFLLHFGLCPGRLFIKRSQCRTKSSATTTSTTMRATTVVWELD
jgi:hypothetical protein